jgi:hypothetical protein
MEFQDTTTLAALSALDSLDSEEQVWIDEHLSDSREWLGQVQDFQSVVSTLGYSAPLLHISPTVKTRLFRQICADDALFAELRARAATVKWKNYAPAPGIKVGVVRVDSRNREVYCFFRSSGAATFPVHRHAGEEEIIVLEGDLRIGEQSYFPGDRIYSPHGTVHQPETDYGCLIYMKTSLDNEWLQS